MLEINEGNVSGPILWLSLLAWILSLLSVSVTAESQWPFESAEYVVWKAAARFWLVTCGPADNTLSPSEHHSAVAHSRDDFWWEASQRCLMGSEESWVGWRGGACCKGTDARISHAKQKHLTKINTSNTNRLHENSQSDSRAVGLSTKEDQQAEATVSQMQ